MKKRRLGIALLVLVLLALLTGYLIWGRDPSREEVLGGAYLDANKNQDIVATYKENSITQGQIDSRETANDMADSPDVQAMTDREITDSIITGFMLLEEAEDRGLAATAAEIEDTIVLLKGQYDEYPETKTSIDDFCRSAVITIDQYWLQVEDTMYGSISRSNLKAALRAEYEAGEWTPYSEEPDFDAAYEAYRTDLLAENSEFITYFD